MGLLKELPAFSRPSAARNWLHTLGGAARPGARARHDFVAANGSERVDVTVTGRRVGKAFPAALRRAALKANRSHQAAKPSLAALA